MSKFEARFDLAIGVVVLILMFVLVCLRHDEVKPRIEFKPFVQNQEEMYCNDTADAGPGEEGLCGTTE